MSNAADMDDRTRAIFRTVVETYLASGAPVGSRTLSRAGGVNLSPASIRNVMQDLEELGLLAAPHTSAGRMPTELGLRLFVDGMMRVAEPTEEERRAIEDRVEGGPIEDALAATSAILSGLSACAGLVLAPKREPALRQFSFVRLSPTQALAILVGTDGSVENRVLPVPADLPNSALVEAGNYLSARLAGRTLAEGRSQLEAEMRANRAALDDASAALVQRGLADWSRDGGDRPVLIVRGQANLLDNAAIADLSRVRQLLDQIETQADIAALVDQVREGPATRIFIGSENQLFALSGSSVIAAPFRDRAGRLIGVVGVIGPTRLNYARIVPMVDFTAEALSRRFG